MRIRIITKDIRFLDFDVETPIYLSDVNNDKFTILIAEEVKS